MKESERERERDASISCEKYCEKQEESRSRNFHLASRRMPRVHRRRSSPPPLCIPCAIFSVRLSYRLYCREEKSESLRPTVRARCMRARARAQSLRNKNPEACAIKHIRAAVIAAEQIDKEEKQRIKASRAYLASGSPRRVPRGRRLYLEQT